MISKDEVTALANRAKYDPILGFGGGYGKRIEVIEFSRVQLERFANACYKRGIEDSIGYILNSYQDHNIASLVEAIRKLGETE